MQVLPNTSEIQRESRNCESSIANGWATVAMVSCEVEVSVRKRDKFPTNVWRDLN